MRVRTLCVIYYVLERDLTVVLSSIEKKISKYDFFSRPFTLNNPNLFYLKNKHEIDQLGKPVQVRMISFAEKYSVKKLANLFSRIQNIEAGVKEKSNSLVMLLTAYVNEEQAVSLHEDNGPHRLPAEKYFLQLQLVGDKSSLEPYDLTLPVFRQQGTITFCNDLRRLLAEKS